MQADVSFTLPRCISVWNFRCRCALYRSEVLRTRVSVFIVKYSWYYVPPTHTAQTHVLYAIWVFIIQRLPHRAIMKLYIWCYRVYAEMNSYVSLETPPSFKSCTDLRLNTFFFGCTDLISPDSLEFTFQFLKKLELIIVSCIKTMFFFSNHRFRSRWRSF